MKLSEKIPGAEQLKLIQGIEAELMQRNRKGKIGLIVALAGAVLPVLTAAIEKDYPKSIGEFFGNLIHFKSDFNELIGIVVLIAGFGTYFLFKRTNLLLKESEEPFHYTFWIKPFEQVSGTPGTRFLLKKDDRFNLLHHDLMERLNHRIGRLSLLDVDSLKLSPSEQQALTSHIHIGGHYAIREERDGKWVIHVMPRIRIGPPGSAEALADPVKYNLVEVEETKSRKSNSKVGKPEPAPASDEEVLDAARYNQIVERVYSSIATEVYRQIRTDVKNKVSMFPTKYLRAVTLFYEAEDFARSNTIDAYDRALELYKESKRYFDIRIIGWIAPYCLKWPILWRFVMRSVHIEARARVGYCRCLIYRRLISTLSGRNLNPLFEIPGEIKRATNNLERLHNRINRKKWRIDLSAYNDGQSSTEGSNDDNQFKTSMAFLTFPKDSPLRRTQPVFEKQCESLFEAYSVAALAYRHLESYKKAKLYVAKAKAVAPVRSQRNALWLLVAAEIEFDITQSLRFLRLATDLAPDFEIAQYRYAYYSDMRLRIRNEVKKERADSVMDRYDWVLSLNPGNIGALAAQGYFQWLLGDLDRARKKYEEGREIRAIARQTFVGDIKYGLARIAAEKGEFNRSYNLYSQAVSSDPQVGAYSPTTSPQVVSTYYDYIYWDILERYQEFKTTVINKIEKISKKANRVDAEEEVSKKTLNAVHSFVLNDYGNACLNYYHRYGTPKQLEEAIKAYEEAISRYPENAVACFNLSNAYAWNGQVEESHKRLEDAERLAPTWIALLIDATRNLARRSRELIPIQKKDWEEEMGKLKEASDKLEENRKLAQESGTKPASEDQFSPVKGETKQEVKTGDWEHDLQAKIEQHRKKARDRELDLNTSYNKLKYALSKFEIIMNQTKLSSLYRTLNINFDGTVVYDLLGAKIGPDRLDEADIIAVKVWAEILSNNVDVENKEALNGSIKLCNLILENYYPEDLDANSILYDVYDRLMKKKEEEIQKEEEVKKKELIRELEEVKKKKEVYRQAINSSINNWLVQDPIYYAALIWARDFFDEGQFIDSLNRAIKLKPDDGSYYFMLGSYYHVKGNYQEAIEQYKKALRADPLNANYFNTLGNAYFVQSDYPNAIENYQHAVNLAPDVEVYKSNLDEARRELKLKLNAEGNEFYNRGDYRNAIEKYKQAIQVGPQEHADHSNLALGWESLKEPGKRIEGIDNAISALKDALALSPETKNYTERLKRLECKRFYAQLIGEKALDMVPIVTPIAVEVANDLVKYVATERDELRQDLNDLIINLRDDINKNMGVTIPGILFRPNERALPPGAYLIIIDDIPVYLGMLSHEKRVFAGGAGELAALGVSGELTINPSTGGEAVLIAEQDWERVEKAGHKLWGAIEYIVKILEAFIRNNLSEFVGHQEVLNMLEAHANLHERFARDPAELSLLVCVIRALLREGVPITSLKEIVERFNQSRERGADLLTIVEEIRSLPEIRPVLPGNNDRHTLHLLGRKFEEEIERSIDRSGFQPVLLMKYESYQSALDLVRQKVAPLPAGILVENAALRPFVRQLIGFDSWLVPILSRQELLAGLEGRIASESELEQSA